jgi:protein O-mannosyl-transferase
MESDAISAVDARKPAKAGPSTRMLAAFILVATALPFLPALRYGFVFDDDVQVVDNVAARHSQSAWTYFVTSIWSLRHSAIPLNYSYYRPLFYSWLRLNVALFGGSAFWWHVSAVATHLGVTLLVFYLVLHHVRNPWSAAVAALIFGVHPVHIESVVWISGATDPLMALGVLASFLLWLKSLEKPSAGLRVGSLACYSAALLCKETAIALPVIVFLYVLLGIPAKWQSLGRLRERVIPAIRKALPFAGVTLVYLGIRTAILQPYRSISQPWISTSQTLLTAPSVLMFYMRQLAWPVGLRLFYDFHVVDHGFSGRFWVPLFVISAMVACLFAACRRTSDSAIPAAAVWLAIPLLPVLDIALFYRDDFLHDRYLYLPSVGLAILCGVLGKSATGWRLAPRGRTLVTASLAGLITALAASAAVQSTTWQDNLSLYSHAAQHSTNTMARINLASELASRGRLEQAEELLEPVQKERPDFWLVNYDLGYVDYRLKDLTAAESYLDRAIAINPREADAYLYRGLILLRRGQHEAAVTMFRQAIALNPVGQGYHFALAITLAARDREAAKSELREELKYHPENGVAKMQLDMLEHPASNSNPASAKGR